MTVHPGDIERNLAEIERLLAATRAAGAELVCFPELCLSGYLLNRDHYSRRLLEATGEALEALAGQVRHGGMTLILGAPREQNGRLRNSVFLIDGIGGERLVYDKTHLDGRERGVFEPGDRFVVGPGGLGLACCYDIAFPEVSRALALQGAQALVFPMAWETRRRFVFDKVRAARAIENVAYVVCANQAANGGEFAFAGGSCIIDPLGDTVCTVDDGEEWVLATLNLAAVRHMRTADEQTFPFFRDRRSGLY